MVKGPNVKFLFVFLFVFLLFLVDLRVARVSRISTPGSPTVPRASWGAPPKVVDRMVLGGMRAQDDPYDRILNIYLPQRRR